MPGTEEDLIAAAMNGDLTTLKECLDAGVDIDTFGNNPKFTALMHAARYGHMEIIRYLVHHGARMDKAYDPLPVAKNYERGKSAAVFFERLERMRNTPEWSLLGTEGLVHVVFSAATERQLTEIFNFASRERVLIIESLKNNTETTFPPVSFNELEKPLLENALEKFRQLDGVADEGFVLRGTVNLKKPSPTPSLG